jgi:hypothetical protein
MAELLSPSGSASVGGLNPLELSDWDARVAVLPGAGFFHTSAWARVLQATYGYQPCYLAISSSGPLHSVLPLMEVASWLTGRRGISLPFTDAVDPLVSKAESFRILWSAALDVARKRGWKYLECRGGKKWLPEAPASTSFLNHVLELSGNESAMLAGVDDSVRRALRKAEQSGLIIEFSQSLDSVRAFYRLLGLTRRRHGVPPQPFSFFANIHENILAKHHGWVVLARKGAVPVAGALFFHSNGTALYKFGASDEAYQHLRANNFVMWHAIRHYAREGLTRLDFGRTSLGNEGLRKFKLGWGTLEERIDYVRYDLRQAAFVTARDEVTGWHNRFFRAMPPAISRLAGTLLYRHIA